MNIYMVFWDREFTEPSTVFGPNIAKATGLLGEFLGATVILYELAPETLVHLRIVVLDVAENTDTWIADEQINVDYYWQREAWIILFINV